jgi:hypothetical protein
MIAGGTGVPVLPLVMAAFNLTREPPGARDGKSILGAKKGGMIFHPAFFRLPVVDVSPAVHPV